MLLLATGVVNLKLLIKVLSSSGKALVVHAFGGVSNAVHAQRVLVTREERVHVGASYNTYRSFVYQCFNLFFKI